MSAPSLRVLVTGSSGQVGTALMKRGADAGFTLLPLRRADLDLTDPTGIGTALDRAAPDVVVNCAAYTAVDQAEREADLAFAVNARGPGHMARWCADNGRPIVHLSTDYVFSGDATRPYREDDPIGPVSVYGASKAEGERQLREAGGRHAIVRTAWVYAASGNNFVRTMLRLGAERPELGVVDDQRGCPTAADSIALAICAIVSRLTERDGDTLAGIYHYVDGGETTWYGLAERIFARVAPGWGRRPVIRPITTAQYPTPAKRPRYSVLDTTKVQTTFGLAVPTWQESLDGVLRDLGCLPIGPTGPSD